MNRSSRLPCLMWLLFLLPLSQLQAQVNITSAGKNAQNAKGQLDVTIGQIDYGASLNKDFYFLEGLQQPFSLHAATLDSLLCASAVFSPESAQAGQNFSGVLSIDYAGGNSLQLNALSIASTELTGFTLSLDATTLAAGDGNLTFSIQGSSADGGTAFFPVDIGGKSCNIAFPVAPETLEVPAFFSPNGDGINDLWAIPYLAAKYPESKVFIFDRFSKLVAQLTAWDAWDGQVEGIELPAGIYWYIVETSDKNNQLTGSITLMR